MTPNSARQTGRRRLFIRTLQAALLVCLAAVLSRAHSEPAMPTLVFTIDSFYAQPLYKEHPARDLMRDALANLGYQYKLRYIKGPRTLSLANNGEVDGEFARNRDYSDEFPNLVRVPEPVNEVNSVIVTRQSLVGEARDWRQLHARSRVFIPGSRVGLQIPERFAQLTKVMASDYDQALKMVARGRADFVIIPANFYYLTQLKDYGDEPLVILAPMLAEEAAYMHLHKRHTHLVQPLAAELKKLKHQRTQSQ